MKPYKVQFFLYAESQEEVDELERALFDFVNEKRNIGIAVSATKVCRALNSFKGNILMNNYLKQQK